MAPLQLEQAQRANELGVAQQPALLQQAERASGGLNQQLATQDLVNQFDVSNAKKLKPFLDSNDQAGVLSQLQAQREITANLVSQQQLPESELLEVDQAIRLASQPQGLQTLKQGTDNFLGIKPVTQEGFTLKPGEKRFDASGSVVASVATEPKPTQITKPINPILLEGLSQEVASKGASAFETAGGGKDGLTAFTKVVDKAQEQERRIASPVILSESFPLASDAEMSQLQAAMDGAKNTSEGLKEAGKIRSEQRRLKKAKVFQDTAVGLIDKILESDELNDVLGSIEGSFDFRLQDSEAELISDIEEARDILTSDNMDLMSGVLSESDIKLLKNLSGGALNRKRSENQFRSRLTELRDRLSGTQVTTADDIASKPKFKEGQTATSPDGRKVVFTNGKWTEL